MKDHSYYFHQTPISLCKDIISNIPFENDDIIIEPFSGEDSFYNHFPEELTKYRCEIEDGTDFKNFDYDGIKPTVLITNPPFRLETENGRKNAFFDIILFYSKITSIKRMYILCNDYCLGTLTPKRLTKLNENNLFINKLTTVNVKKWRGRYYIIEFGREPNRSFDYYLTNYE
jgi:hypothetical protein